MDVEGLKRAVEAMGAGRRGRRRRFETGLRRELVAAVDAMKLQGMTAIAIGEALGISRETVRRFVDETSRGSGALLAVRVKRERSPSVRPHAPRATNGPLVMHGPGGMRIEGLELDEVAALWRQLR